MKQSATRKLVMAAMCAALGVVLPQAFHMVPNAGSVLLPMHIPVLLCGLACGWPYGLACGILAPLLSSLAHRYGPLRPTCPPCSASWRLTAWCPAS